MISYYKFVGANDIKFGGFTEACLDLYIIYIFYINHLTSAHVLSIQSYKYNKNIIYLTVYIKIYSLVCAYIYIHLNS